MKKRIGFVSNSSTSSFCLFGAHFDNLSEIIECEWQQSDLLKECYRKSRKLGLQFVSCDEYGDGYYAGLRWTRVADNETGKEFKERAIKLVEKFVSKKIKCKTYQGVYPS